MSSMSASKQKSREELKKLIKNREEAVAREVEADNNPAELNRPHADQRPGDVEIELQEIVARPPDAGNIYPGPANRQAHAVQAHIPNGHAHIISGQDDAIEAVPNANGDNDGPFSCVSNIRTASATFTLTLLNLMLITTLIFLHFNYGNSDVGVTTITVLLLSGIFVAICLLTLNSCVDARMNLWHCSKVTWLLAAVPCLTTQLLASLYLVAGFSDRNIQLARRARYRDMMPAMNPARVFIPPTSEDWRLGSGPLFHINSLTLYFPLCILYLCFLAEDSATHDFSLLAKYALFGVVSFTFSVTFFRVHNPCGIKACLGMGFRRYFKFCLFWASDVMWMETFSIFILTARFYFPQWTIMATAGAFLLLVVAYEVPLWLWRAFYVSRFDTVECKVTPLLFLYTQLISFACVVFWMSSDDQINKRGMTPILIALYIVTEIALVAGWMFHVSFRVAFDTFSVYPNMFGGVLMAYYPTVEAPSP